MAQATPIPSGNTVAEIIAAAERQGQAFSRYETPQEPTPVLATHRRGSAERRCVEGFEFGPVRSGEFVIGGQLAGSRMMTAGRRGKVWWAPLNHSLDMPPLVVRGRNLSSRTDTVHYSTPDVAWPVTPGALPIPEARREYFFPSGISLPTRGRWLLIATSGSNWGCFIISAK
ncbi:MAG TPA: hypothetical protein VMO26_30035 [Vicinamibacterales bacterium]|nr:hypothetical protein [Vicinamibacterales bacterium]